MGPLPTALCKGDSPLMDVNQSIVEGSCWPRWDLRKGNQSMLVRVDLGFCNPARDGKDFVAFAESMGE